MDRPEPADGGPSDSAAVDASGSLNDGGAEDDGGAAGHTIGIRDMTFGGAGAHSETGYLDGNAFRAALVDDQNRLYIAGQLQVSPSDWGDLIVQRLLPDGTLDPTFNHTGSVVFDFTPFELAVGLHLIPNHVLRVGGARTVQEDPLVLSLREDGTLDDQFGSVGIALKPIPGENLPRAMAVDPVDGAYYLVGDDYGDTLYVVKFTAAGAPDSAFGLDGHRQLPPSIHGNAAAAVVDSNQKLLIAGNIRPAGLSDDSSAVVWRLNPDGNLDPTFASEGVLIINNVADVDVDEVASGIVVGPGNDAFVTGHITRASQQNLVVWHIHKSGDVDRDFGGDSTGVVEFSDLMGAGLNSQGRVIQFDPSGRLWVAGTGSNGVNDDIVLLRLSVDGELDTQLGNRGMVVLRDLLGYAGNDTVMGLASSGDGTVYLCGSATGPDGHQDAVVVKLH